MSAWKSKAAHLLLDVAILFAVFFGTRAWSQRNLVEGMAPPLSGVTSSSQPVTLDQYRGAPLVLHFWATWCGVCRREEGSMLTLARDFPVLSVATDSGPAEAVRSYVTTRGLNFPVVLDEGAELAEAYGVRAFPTTFYIDSKGKILFREVGYTSELGMKARVWLLKLIG
jgi:thiol-disulfide isomerase/thioredoxin